MSNIFNEFYRGNLSPADKRMVKGSEMVRGMKRTGTIRKSPPRT